MKQLTNLKKVLVLMISIITLASCSDIEPTPRAPAARLALHNAYSPIPTIQPRVNDLAAAAIPYGRADGYYEFTNITNQTLTFINQGTNQVLVDRVPLSIELEGEYTGVIYGNAIPGKFILLKDTVIQNASTNPRIRFLNVAEGVQAVDLFIGTDRIESLSNRSQEDQSSSRLSERFILSTRPAGATDITVRDQQGNVIATLPSYNFGAARYYTIMLLGDSAFNEQSPTAEDRLKALRINTFAH